MGTNIIDAFVVTFGLDDRGWKSGSRDVRKDFRDVKDEGKKAFDEIEKRGKNSAIAVRGLASEAAGLLLILGGANSFKNFVEGMLTGAANADRLGNTLGMTASRITGWQVATKELGGSAEDASVALQRMMDIAFKYKFGQGAEPGLNALGITTDDLNRADPEAMLLKLAEARSRFSPQDYARRLQMLGLPQSTIYLLEQGTEAVRKQVDEAERHANVTKQDAVEAERLQKALADLEATVAGKLRPTITGLAKDLTSLVSVMGTKDEPGSVNGALVTMGVVAAIAGRPFFALAAAIGLVANNLGYLKQKWKDYEDWYYKTFGGSPNDTFTDMQGNKIGNGRIVKPDGTTYDVWTGKTTKPSSGGGAVSGGSAGAVAGSYIGSISGATGGGTSQLRSRITTSLLSYGISPEVARGVVAGIVAEGGSPTARNPTSGAFGIGQWLGRRKQELFRRYGRNPTLDQQIAFLVSELKGGDHGGASVLSRESAVGAMVAYLRDFMRPGAGLAGDLRRGYADLGVTYRGGASRGAGTTNIGTIVVNTRATDAKGIARDIGGALRDRSLNSQAAVGLTP